MQTVKFLTLSKLIGCKHLMKEVFLHGFPVWLPRLHATLVFLSVCHAACALLSDNTLYSVRVLCFCSNLSFICPKCPYSFINSAALFLETVTCMKGCASNTKMSCSHTKTFGKSRSENNAITATVTGLRLSRIKHWNPLASNPGYPFQILSHNFGEKSCFPFQILSHNFGEKSCFPFRILSHNFGEKLCFPFRILSRSFGGKKRTIFLQIRKSEMESLDLRLGIPRPCAIHPFQGYNQTLSSECITIHSQAGIN